MIEVTGNDPFDEKAEEELFEALDKPHIDGITFSGGDPLFPNNRSEVFRLIKKIRNKLPQKTIWLYTGYTWEQIKDLEGINDIDVIAEGEFIEELKDNNIHWVGSSNQRVIDVKKTNKGNRNRCSYCSISNTFIYLSLEENPKRKNNKTESSQLKS